jgi:hypothetical protein
MHNLLRQTVPNFRPSRMVLSPLLLERVASRASCYIVMAYQSWTPEYRGTLEYAIA